MPIYLDHTATTRPDPAVIACLTRQLETYYANPSSTHQAGQAAARFLLDERRHMAALLDCSPDEIIFTSGGSESVNLAVKGAVWAKSRPVRIIISKGEHAAVAESAGWLARQGLAVDWIPLDADGRISLPDLERALQEPADLISLIHVSNETGAVNDIAAVSMLRDRLQPAALIHLDAVQTFGKLPFSFRQSGADLVSASGHKFKAPRGTGFLIRRSGLHLAPLIHGGGQQSGLRAGTENPAAAAALALALQLAVAQIGSGAGAAARHRSAFLSQLADAGVHFRVLSPDDAVPHILSLAFLGLRGETLQNALSADDIYLSTGSACSSRRGKPNRVLSAMGLPEETVRCAVRISFAADNTADEISLAAEKIAGHWHKLHRQLPRKSDRRLSDKNSGRTE